MRYLPSIFSDKLDDFFEGEFVPTSYGSNSPATDIYQTKNNVVVKASLPGYKDDQVDISLEDNVLTICGKKKTEKVEKDDSMQYYRKEIKTEEEFSRSFRLPSLVKTAEDEVKASFKDGELKIVLPKAEEAKSKKIKIKKS